MTGTSEPNRTGIDLLFANLSLAAAFLEIAGTSTNAEARQRNTKHAREAYDAAVRLLSRVTPNAEENKSISTKLADLKKRLEADGEVLD